MITIVFGLFLAAATYVAFTSPATPMVWAILGIFSAVYGIYVSIRTSQKTDFVGRLVFLLLTIVSCFGGFLMFVYGINRL